MHNHAPPDYECFVCNVVAETPATAWSSRRTSTPFAIVSRRVGEGARPRAGGAEGALREPLRPRRPPPASTSTGLTRRIVIGLKEAFACDGTSTRQHNEPAGNQDLWHLHVHVFPRYDGDDLYGSWYRDSTYEERLDFAARLQAAL